MPRPPETAVFVVSEAVVRGETLFDTGAEQSEWRAEEDPYAGSRFRCYSRPNRLKTIKRQMYGRAGLVLLRARVVNAA